MTRGRERERESFSVGSEKLHNSRKRERADKNVTANVQHPRERRKESLPSTFEKSRRFQILNNQNRKEKESERGEKEKR